MTRTAKADKGIRKTAERALTQQTFLGMLYFAQYIMEGTSFAIRCFDAHYPDLFSNQRLYELEKNKDSIREAAERVMMQQTFFGMLLSAHYVQESTDFAIRCFQARYPGILSSQRLYALAQLFYEDFYQKEK